ncbi:hypothetical protein BOTCAL_0277g00180 [Botryotinia calthae]|uniref:Piwi domain-containing protein n=1 Tax=Botryotinia calthae TaxID=38488 RepID=A0A4Y8CY82_9HELO|nr:hypothetical protein BOTCAL_0277g00180 [Botryotinia calthae]
MYLLWERMTALGFENRRITIVRARVYINNLSILEDISFLRFSKEPGKFYRSIPIFGQNKGTNTFRMPTALDPKFWSLTSTGTNDKFPPQLIEIKKYDVTFETFTSEQTSENRYRRPWIVNFEVKSIRKSQNATNPVNLTPRALHLSPSCFKLDYRIKNPVLFRPSCDALFFRKFSHLLGYAVATKGIVTNYATPGPVKNETFPKIERVVVGLEIHTPINWNFHEILVELLKAMKEVGTLKGVILLVRQQSLRGQEILRIDDDLKKRVDGSPDVYTHPASVSMPRIACMATQTFESKTGWNGLDQTNG